MLDINDLMEMFEDADTYGVDTVSLTIRSRKGTKIELMMCQPIIDPKELAKPEEKKDPEKVKLTDEEIKQALEAVKEENPAPKKRGGYHRKPKSVDKILDDMASKRGEL